MLDRQRVCRIGLLLALPLLLLTGCRQEMANQPAYRPLTPSELFPDGRSARPLVAGTIARGQLRDDSELDEGRNEKGEVISVFPFAMTEEVLKRGQQRYTVFCSVCHGLTGNADGRIVQRGFTKPPNFNTDISRYYKLRDAKDERPLTTVPVGHFFDVVTHGFGAMPDYASQIPIKDRWAIVGYVRTLQLSQASPAERQKMEAGWAQAVKKTEKKAEKEEKKK